MKQNYNSMKKYLKEHPEDEDVKDELLAFEKGFRKGKAEERKEVLDFINKQRDSGNIQKSPGWNEVVFSPAICLFDLIKFLEGKQ